MKMVSNMKTTRKIIPKFKKKKSTLVYVRLIEDMNKMFGLLQS